MIGSAQNALLQQQMALMAKNALGGVLNIPQRPLGRTMIAPPQPTTMVTPPSPDWLKGQTPGFAPDTTNYQLPGFTPTPPQDPNEEIRLKALLQQLFQKQQLENMFNPMIGYHGTRANIDNFRPSKIGAMGPGIYFSKDKELASRYAQNNTKWDGFDLSPKLYRANVEVKNPFVISSVNASPDELFKIFNPDGTLTDEQVIQKVREAGYDGIHAKKEGEFVAFEPSQIKSHSFKELTEQDMEVAKRQSKKAAQNLLKKQ